MGMGEGTRGGGGGPFSAKGVASVEVTEGSD